MNKEHNYVDCNRCKNWDDEYRREQVCQGCNNTRQIIDPKDVLCNRCGGPQRPLGTMNEQYPHGLENILVMGGYNSYHIFDMTSYKFSICEKCLREMFNQFAIKPSVLDAISGRSSLDFWPEDQELYEYRVWKDSGGHHQAYLDRKCNFIKDCPNKAEYTQLLSDSFTEDCCCEEHKEFGHNYLNGKLTKFIPNVLKPFL